MLLKDSAIRKEKGLWKNKAYPIYIFKCKNPECDEEIRCQSTTLKTHSGKCKRCTQLGEPYAHIYNELKNHKRKGTSVEFTFEEFLEVIKDPKCHYCGEVLTYNKHSKEWSVGNSRAHQLDRKDNSIGYTKDNVVCCCWTCNRLKSDAFSYEEFLLLSPALKKIKKLRNSKK